MTPLPGGTSVLERVLYSIEQMNLSSPGAMAPVNGVYANIAESVLDREWYTTDRTGVAFEDYQEDIVTTRSAPIDFTLLSSLPGDGTITLEDGTVVNVLDIPIATIRVWESEGFVRPNTEESTAYWDGGTLEYTFTARDFGKWFNYEATITEQFTEHYRPYQFRINEDATFEFRLVEGLYVSNKTMEEIAVVLTVGDEYFRFDSVETAIGAGEMSPFSYDGIVYDFSTDFFGASVNPAAGAGAVPVAALATLQLSLDSTGNPTWILPAAATDETEFITYSWDETVTTDYTRQLDSFFVDWWQREFAMEIDGSVTNVITGVNTTVQEVAIGATSAVQVTLSTIDLGDITTTALGAVNTGDITVGVNSAVDEAATSTTRAIQASLTVVGGSSETGTMMLNIAHNTSMIRGNVENTLIEVNGSVGDISTTALGAVNTGTITSGLDAAIQGIVGMSGQF